MFKPFSLAMIGLGIFGGLAIGSAGLLYYNKIKYEKSIDKNIEKRENQGNQIERFKFNNK